jgi:UDP-N-acetylglucosamine 2-epimerase (non-hydrolysing)
MREKSDNIKILSVFGTRPEAIKMAPVVRELESCSDVDSRVVVTAQHREMLDQVMETFNIKPDYDLEIMRQGQDLFDVTTAVLNGLKGILQSERPDMVLVQGDTTTTFTGALAAFYCQIPVGHIEAGLRTYQKYAPFPEELNRVLTTGVSDLHFAPTDRSREALLREGIDSKSVFVTGNTVIDALYQALEKPFAQIPELTRAFQENKRVILLTTHRRENLGAPLQNIYKALREVLRSHPDVGVVFPMHKNPAVRREVNSFLRGVERVYLTEPLDYLPFINVMKMSHIVLTDSGGIQEEAPALGKPVLVLREVTERPEATAFGTARLIGTDPQQVKSEVNLLLDNQDAYLKMANAVNPYGDGMAARRIVQAVKSYFGKGEAAVDYNPGKFDEFTIQ